MPPTIEELQQQLDRLHTILASNQRFWLTGMMMGNFIHDLNNPLTSVNGNVELLQINPIMADPKIKKRIDTINNGVKRLSEKLRELQLFTKTTSSETLININDLVKEAVHVAGYLPKPNKLPITLNLDSKLLTFTGNAYKLAQALLMIIDNALDSIIYITNPEISVSTSQDLAGKILIKITNNGSMISKELEEKIFEPFFSTKTNALGMGLTVAREMILSNLGTLTFTSNETQTEFIITLPVK
ncbi:MAG: HAMP domain-containing histidine kinase [Blastocatellia bacterium]|nr:HAMP domain-containing histidine kinase [Blastocatellia bacterium]